jgi:hypothetical protein
MKRLAELNPRSEATSVDYKLLGTVLSLALIFREVFRVTFVPPFYKSLPGHSTEFADLAGIDLQLYRNLEAIRLAALLIVRNEDDV